MKLIDIEELKSKQTTIITNQGETVTVIELSEITKLKALDINQLVPLEPCPCCNGKAEVIHTKTSEINKNYSKKYDDLYSVECTNCGLKTGDYTYSPYRAIEAWNHRPKNTKN